MRWWGSCPCHSSWKAQQLGDVLPDILCRQDCRGVNEIWEWTQSHSPRMTIKRTLLAFVLASFLSGCMNLYTRCPGTPPRIEDTYQSTCSTAGMSYVVMFPQVIMSTGNNEVLYPENIISIPLGCICFVDVALEAVIDTVCYPADAMLRNNRAVKEISVE